MALQKYGSPEKVESVDEEAPAEDFVGAGQPQPEFLQDGAVAPDGDPVEDSSSDS